MKKYYLVAEKSVIGDRYTIRVTDNPRGMEILKEFESESYSEAVKQYSFSASSMGKAVYCGVDTNGKPYHGEA